MTIELAELPNVPVAPAELDLPQQTVSAPRA
jgi:hypothetical protein